MNTSIKSSKLQRVVSFTRVEGKSIFTDLNGKPDDQGLPICEKGGVVGKLMTYEGDSQHIFNAICKRWFKAYTKNLDSDTLTHHLF